MTRFLLILTMVTVLLSGCSSVIRDRSTMGEFAARSAAVAEDETAYGGVDSLRNAADEEDQQAQQIMEEIRLAEEYYAYGVQANGVERWQEAQYNFEKALSLLSELNIDREDKSPVGFSYGKLIDDIRAEYKLTLLYLATIPGEASSQAFVDRFGEIDDFGKLKDEKVITTVDTHQEYDIPVVVNSKVENCIVYFQTIARDFFQAALTRSGRYTSLMMKILEEERVPRDLVYLPLIESGFKTNAYSWASAMGPWQFISATGRRFGMERDWWFDERRDYEKSTRAAARYLKYLYERYGDWYLALAAYNAGEGKVDKVIKRDGTRDYWHMSHLKRETRNYVPLFLSSMIIAKNPEKYGFIPFYDDPLQYDIVTVDKPLDLYEVAEALGTTYDYLKMLNPELLRKQTHPHKESYALRIPSNQKEKFWGVYDQLAAARSATLVHHKIGKGQTLSGIAKRYGISTQALANANNMSKKQRLMAGRTLLIPVPQSAKESRPSQQLNRKSYDASRTTGEGSDLYVVRKGDNLAGIASAHGTTVNQLVMVNGLDKSARIYPGQVINVGVKRFSQSRQSSASSSAPRASKSQHIMTYKVREGDSLYKLAKQYGTTSANLALLHGFESNRRLRVGQLINVPARSSGSKAKTAASILMYVVRAGDTLWDIASAFRCSVEEIVKLNNLTSVKLNIGDRLKIAKS
ncbi:MAG: LysM peptidoglycan-binding domain-containing protein [Candidatus Zixiibacteriota bacterium]|nr:MAG: LysM peptidoglycan-binding domain-containing protein [candidate division Zixibacteria bacterium]